MAFQRWPFSDFTLQIGGVEFEMQSGAVSH